MAVIITFIVLELKLPRGESFAALAPFTATRCLVSFRDNVAWLVGCHELHIQPMVQARVKDPWNRKL